LHELVGNDFQLEIINLYAAEQYAAAYIEKNPNHNVPTLELRTSDGRAMTMIESGAMVILLADSFPDKHLAPASAQACLERADYLQMVQFGSPPMDMMLWQIRIHEHLLPKSQRDIKTIDRYRRKFTDEVEPQLRARLEKRKFICGDGFSAADCVIGQNVLWAKSYHLCNDSVFAEYLARLSERSAFKQAFSDADRFTPEVPEGSPSIGKFTS
jgi:glutathione S-transferase